MNAAAPGPVTIGQESERYIVRLLIDTDVWLNLAKDHRQRPTISALEELTKADVVRLIVPQQVIEEFRRNKERVVRESGQSLASTIRRARDALKSFGEGDGRDQALAHLADVDHRIASLGETANKAIGRIEALFAAAEILATDDATLLAPRSARSTAGRPSTTRRTASGTPS